MDHEKAQPRRHRGGSIPPKPRGPNKPQPSFQHPRDSLHTGRPPSRSTRIQARRRSPHQRGARRPTRPSPTRPGHGTRRTEMTITGPPAVPSGRETTGLSQARDVASRARSKREACVGRRGGWVSLAPHDANLDPVLRVQAIVPWERGREGPSWDASSPAIPGSFLSQARDLSWHRAYEMKIHAG